MEKVVIVTGATGGLGAEIARRFGSAGARVVVNGRTQATVERLAGELNKGPGKVFGYAADVSSYQQVKAMVEATVERWGRVDVLVNAAGGTLAMLTGKADKLLLEHTEEEWDLVVDVNLKGTFNCLKAVAPQMIKQKGGHIILVSSGSGIKPGWLMSSYTAAKAGVFGLMKAAARELGEYDIKVNAVCPGLIVHERTGMYQAKIENSLRDTMLGRLSDPAEFADFIVYLSQKANISGQTFNLDSKILF
ncbi:MAG: SDR family oxidoreductase [Chloroflexi bacterium]|nr:SDR family oxidoreductase [Chloroflexota bacterium]